MMKYTVAEMAALDAMGLLEADERREFALSIERADPTEQRRVQQIQEAVIAAHIDVLPAVAPPASLRARVVDYVCGLIERDFAESVTPASAGIAPPSLRDPFTRRREWFENSVIGGRVSPLWRVAALIFASATLAFGYVSYDVYTTSRDLLHNLVIPDEMQRVVERHFGRPIDSFLLDPTVELVQFHATDNTSELAALLSVTEEGRSLLVVNNLPRTERQYRVFIQTSDDSDPMLLAEFDARPEGATAVDLELPRELIASARSGSASWWIEGIHPATEEWATLLVSAV